MDESLKNLQTDHMDAYYLIGVDNPSLVRSEEVCKAFLKANAEGEVSYFGLSSHQNTHNVFEAAIETGWYDLAMIVAEIVEEGNNDHDRTQRIKDLMGERLSQCKNTN